jgi:hypothetical protein
LVLNKVYTLNLKVVKGNLGKMWENGFLGVASQGVAFWALTLQRDCAKFTLGVMEWQSKYQK